MPVLVAKSICSNPGVGLRPDLRYHANATTLWLIVKEEHEAEAADTLQGSDVQFTK